MGKRAAKQTSAGKRFCIFMIIAALVVAAVFACTQYINNYYEATGIADEAMRGSSRVSVIESEDYYLFLPVEGAPLDKKESSGALTEADSDAVERLSAAESEERQGIIFYPGGKVEETAYAPLMVRLAECGYEVYLMRMPARLAVLKPSAADIVIDHAAVEAGSEDVDGADMADLIIGQDSDRQWILMGHSLGGAMAASYAAKHSDRVSALVLLAAYSTADLSDSGIRVLSMYGSEDGVMNRDKYQENRENLPEEAEEIIIDGGNHAGFAFYGEQKGDRPAAISGEEQQETVVDAVSHLLL